MRLIAARMLSCSELNAKSIGMGFLGRLVLEAYQIARRFPVLDPVRDRAPRPEPERAQAVNKVARSAPLRLGYWHAPNKQIIQGIEHDVRERACAAGSIGA